MKLERIIINAKNVGKRTLFGFGLISTLSFSSCTKYIEVPTEPKEQTPSGTTPDTPNISEIIPYSNEPSRGIQLLIQDCSENEDGFNLEKREENGAFTAIQPLPAKAGAGSRFTYNDLGLKTSTLYTYRIRAYNKFGNSGWNEKSGYSLGLQSGVVEVKATADTYVRKSDPTKNFNDRGYFYISRGKFDANSPFDDEQQAFLLFTLPVLPSYSRGFKSATLRLADASGGNTLYPGALTIYAGEVALNDWTENTLNWNNKPTIVSYSSQTATHDPRNISYVLIDVSKSVSNWYSNVIPNRGFGLFTSSNDKYCGYYSREGYQPGSANLAVVYNW
jgi:hypothetical protein